MLMIETMKYINFSHSINYLNTNIAITGVLVSIAVVIVVKELTITVQSVPSSSVITLPSKKSHSPVF